MRETILALVTSCLKGAPHSRIKCGAGFNPFPQGERERKRRNYPMEIKIIRSRRRRRTVSARIAGEIMYVRAPMDIPEKKLGEIIRNLKAQFERQKIKKKLNSREDLENIVERLNKRYFGGNVKVISIKYVTNQLKQFGSCSYHRGTIRLSHRLTGMPEWVRDYVIVHEMAHIIEPNHSKTFWDLVSRYKLTERARGYLLAQGFEIEGDIQE